MTNQEKKAWLMQYRAAEREERRLSEELERWRSRAESATARSGADTCGGGDGRSLEHAAEHIAHLAAQLEHQRIGLVRLRREIGAAIDGRTWEQVAEFMGYDDPRWVYVLHGNALNALGLEH